MHREMRAVLQFEPGRVDILVPFLVVIPYFRNAVVAEAETVPCDGLGSLSVHQERLQRFL